MLILEDLIEAEIDIWDERAAIREYDGNLCLLSIENCFACWTYYILKHENEWY